MAGPDTPAGDTGLRVHLCIEIDEAHRGAGYGRALLAAAEDAVRSRGVGAVELNVFGDNARAIRLYKTSGYQVVTQQMRKSLQ